MSELKWESWVNNSACSGGSQISACIEITWRIVEPQITGTYALGGGEELRICISNKFPDDADVTDGGPHFKKPWPRKDQGKKCYHSNI